MKQSISLIALLILGMTILATAAEKTPHTYVKGVITGYESRLDTWNMGSDSNKRREKVYELKGDDMVYKVGYCGAFQAGKFTPGQSVEYRVEGERLYILHDKEYGCKIEGRKIEGSKTRDDAKPADAPKSN